MIPVTLSGVASAAVLQFPAVPNAGDVILFKGRRYEVQRRIWVMGTGDAAREAPSSAVLEVTEILEQSGVRRWPPG